VPVDSWLVLLFSDDRPHVFAECPYEGGGPEPVALLDLVQPWVAGLMRQRMVFGRVLAEHASHHAPRRNGGFEQAMERLGTPLTARELDVVRLLLSGRSNKEVAGKLAISAETVKVHRRNIYGKLNINSPRASRPLRSGRAPPHDISAGRRPSRAPHRTAQARPATD
jgi:DNA-binding NarL/FixJ family response regulator